MGYRTTVIFSNDNLDILVQDQDIGRKICSAILRFASTDDGSFGPLGCVIEQSHADVAKLGIIGACGQFNFIELASSHILQADPLKNVTVDLLKQVADDMGFYLTKKAVKGKKTEAIHQTVEPTLDKPIDGEGC